MVEYGAFESADAGDAIITHIDITDAHATIHALNAFIPAPP
jgi:hypothetical protein